MGLFRGADSNYYPAWVAQAKAAPNLAVAAPQPYLPQTYLSPATTAKQQASPAFTDVPIWQTKDLPLTVCFNPQSHWQQELLQQVLQEWAEASQHKISFASPVTTLTKQGIRITWQPEPPNNLPFQVGLAKNTLNEQGYIVASEISLIENPVIDQHLSREQQVWRLRSTLLHELGHALGLEHSLCSEHVMYFRGWRNTYLSSGDAQAIQKLYS